MLPEPHWFGDPCGDKDYPQDPEFNEPYGNPAGMFILLGRGETSFPDLRISLKPAVFH